MGEKGKILLFFITIIFAGVILVLVALLTTDLTSIDEPSDDGDEIETASEDDEENFITIGDQQGDSFRYASITEDDSVTLYREDGTTLDVNLERRKWHNLQISPDPHVISVLGDRTEDSSDLALYFIENERFGWYTDYGSQSTGVLQYGWLDDETVFFHQGEGTDEWFHTFFYPSQVQINKIFRSQGIFADISSDASDILYQFPTGFELFDFMGQVTWDMGQVRTVTEESLNVTDPLFTLDPEKVVFTSLVENGVGIYKVLVGESEAVKIDIEFSNFVPVCAISEDEIYGIRTVSSDEVTHEEIILVNVKDEVWETVVQLDDELGSAIAESFDCSQPNEFIFSQDTGERNTWLKVTKDEFLILPYLQNNKEVKVISNEE